MSTVRDMTADLSPTATLQPVQTLTPEEVATLAEELAIYHQHFASFFFRREQREWAGVYLRGRLRRTCRARMLKRWPCAC